MKKIVSYNVNGLRSAIQKGFTDWLKNNSFDLVCLQETKMDESHADPNYFIEQGYHAYWHCAEKKGYSGVLILSKEKAKKVTEGWGLEIYDKEGRMIKLDFDNWSLMNTYFPSGSASEERHEFKMQFLKDINPVIKKHLKQTPNLIIVGDYNIVHKDLDIHNPTRKDFPSGFRPEERAWLDKWFNESFDDPFRIKYPEQQAFSWWSYRAGSYQKDKGWRIDYHSISKDFSKVVLDYKHHKEIRFSDHCPVEGIYNI